MIRHIPLPEPGKGHRAPSEMASAPAHHRQRAGRGHHPAGPADLAPLLITDPATVTNNRPATAGRVQRSLRQ